MQINVPVELIINARKNAKYAQMMFHVNIKLGTKGAIYVQR